jgi:multidrug efflux pump subunit AcrA (membrane-fusion protein)
VVESSDSQSTAILRWVKTGKTQGTQVEIVSGLTEGDRIITSHLDQLNDGQVVQVGK